MGLVEGLNEEISVKPLIKYLTWYQYYLHLYHHYCHQRHREGVTEHESCQDVGIRLLLLRE